LKIVFFVSIGLIVYAYLLYPAIMVVWARLFPRRVEKR